MLKTTDVTMSRNILKRGINYFFTTHSRYQFVNRFSNNVDDNDIKEQKINIQGLDINYCKIGIGEHPVLLLPGFMGTILNNFEHQLRNLDRKKITMVSLDVPGYGKSIPPNRDFSDNYVAHDATYAKCLMDALGFKSFSMIGWCQGGLTALHLAGMHTEAVRKLILIGTQSKIFPTEGSRLKKATNPDSWSVEGVKLLNSIYGERYAKKVSLMWIYRMIEIYENHGGEFGIDFEKIRCPTLIVHGDSDKVVDKEHAAVLRKRIRNSRVCIMKNGSHDIHKQFSKEFNHLATEFLLSQQDC